MHCMIFLKKVKLYKSLRQMNYLIKEDIFINIQDVIALPGQCILLVKKCLQY